MQPAEWPPQDMGSTMAFEAEPGPKRQRKGSVGLIVLAAIICIALLVLAGFLVLPHLSDDENARKIGPAGGSLTAHGVTVIVPQGAVDREVELTISKPTKPAALDSPLKEMGGSVLEFNISLDKGRVTRPKQPLTLQLAPGTFFANTPANLVWLYSPDESEQTKRRYEFIPLVSANGKLEAKLTHLSPFDVVAPDIQKWVGGVTAKFGSMWRDAGKWVQSNATPDGIRKSRPKDCRQQLKNGSSTISFTAGPQSGWGYNPESSVHPCLKVTAKGNLEVTVINNTLNYWGVKTASGARLTSSPDGMEAELVKLLLKKVIGQKGTQEYLARGGTLKAEANGLNGMHLQLQTDWGAFHAEELVVVLGIVTNILGADLGAIKSLLEIGEVTDCLKGAVKVSASRGSIVSQLTDMLGILTGICGEKIAENLGYAVNDFGWLKQLQAIEGIGKAAIGLLGGIEGVVRKLSGRPIDIFVSVVRPASCLTNAGFVAGGYYQKPPEATGFRVIESACDGNYAVFQFGDSMAENNIYLLKRDGMSWGLIWTNEGAADPPPCDKVSAKVGRLLNC